MSEKQTHGGAPAVHVTFGGRVYVDADEQLKTENAKDAMEKMNNLLKKLGGTEVVDSNNPDKQSNG